MTSAEPKLPTITDRSQVLYYVTIFEFPKATVRHQVFVDNWPQERVTTFDQWVVLEAERIGRRTGMSFGIAHNNEGQMALAALKVS